MPLLPGTVVGQYEILTSLGAGSMGEVYRARDTRLDRDVAIKILPGLVSMDRDRLLRFEQEAKAAAALNHPNILAIYQMGAYEGMPYLVFELLEGRTLTEVIRRGPVPMRKAIDYAVQIARGLAAAHEKGILHRDLKPANLFITKDDQLKILDFGLAKFTQPKQSLPHAAVTVTLPGVALGTIGYMAPEQVRALPTDHRADIFSFGAILYEMVMGKPTFDRKTSADTISAILNEEPASMSQLAPDTPAAIERIVRRCLEKNPELRFQSASDLAFALEALTHPSAAGVQPAQTQAAPSGNWKYAAIAGMVVLLLFLGGYFLTQPASVPRVSNYRQLTHDGQQKSIIGTDGARVYLSLGEVRAGSFAFHGIAEISAGGGAPKKLSITPSVNMVPLDLSPDGSEVLVIDGEGAPPKGPLWSLEVLGGSPRRLGDIVAETASWSPNGKMIAYTVLGNLFLAKADGSESHKLISVKGDILNVVWSPDGSRLRFNASETAGTVGQQLEYEVSASGKGLHRLFEGWHNPPDECCGRWTPDGKYFVFQSAGQIWAVLEKSGFFSSDTRPVQLTSSPLSLSTPVPSKDGKKMFVIGQTYRGELTRYDGKSGQMTPFLNGISAEYVAFSKDGQWVAYVSYREGTLWRSNVDGSERVQLTYPPMYPVLPRWSPDGKSIIFFEFATTGDKPARMYEVSANGGSPQAILPDDHGQQLDPNWSSDGTKIIFAGESNDPSSSIRILDLSTHKVSRLPASDGLYSPRWSPDGRYISAFSADSKTLLLFDMQTQKWSELAQGSLSWLNWSHDSKYVYVLDFRNRDAVVRIRVSDHKVEPVVDLRNFITAGRYGGWLALAPDDSPLLLRDTGAQDVYSVDWEAP
jgi:eukaryotic-like serine/threonine-protein kinase